MTCLARCVVLALALTVLSTLCDSKIVRPSIIRRPEAALTVKVGDSTFNVMDYGAKGDGKNDDTDAVQKALDACEDAKGGTVLWPEGKTFLVFGLTFKSSNTQYQIEGTIVFNNDRDSDKWKSEPKACIVAEDLDSIVITGSGKGVVDGQGQVWWQHRDDYRPDMFYTHGCTNVLFQDITFKDSPNHNLELYSDHTELSNVTILAPPSTGTDNPSHNTDAVDVHGDPFYIHDCMFSVGDDNIAAHMNNTLVEHCRFGTGHGASIGSIGSGTWLQNLTFTSIVFDGTTAGCRIKVDSGASDGTVKNVVYSNLTMKNVETAIDLTMFYSAEPPVSHSSSKFLIQNISFVDITTDTSGPGNFDCSSDSPCVDLLLQNVVNKDPTGAFECQNAYGTNKGTVTPKSCLKSN